MFTYLYFINRNMTGATSGAGTAYPSGAPEFTPSYIGDNGNMLQNIIFSDTMKMSESNLYRNDL
jgi:hypothetical protein